MLADFDYAKEGGGKTGYYRVGGNDLNILSQYWKKPDANDPNVNVIAATIIDANDPNTAVVTFDGNDANSVLSGLTLTGGKYGIYCSNSVSPVIKNCIIKDNNSHGIYCTSGWPGQ